MISQEGQSYDFAIAFGSYQNNRDKNEITSIGKNDCIFLMASE